jgi:hypothetical protein
MHPSIARAREKIREIDESGIHEDLARRRERDLLDVDVVTREGPTLVFKTREPQPQAGDDWNRWLARALADHDKMLLAGIAEFASEYTTSRLKPLVGEIAELRAAVDVLRAEQEQQKRRWWR